MNQCSPKTACLVFRNVPSNLPLARRNLFLMGCICGNHKVKDPLPLLNADRKNRLSQFLLLVWIDQLNSSSESPVTCGVFGTRGTLLILHQTGKGLKQQEKFSLLLTASQSRARWKAKSFLPGQDSSLIWCQAGIHSKTTRKHQLKGKGENLLSTAY